MRSSGLSTNQQIEPSSARNSGKDRTASALRCRRRGGLFSYRSKTVQGEDAVAGWDVGVSTFHIPLSYHRGLSQRAESYAKTLALVTVKLGKSVSFFFFCNRQHLCTRQAGNDESSAVQYFFYLPLPKAFQSLFELSLSKFEARSLRNTSLCSREISVYDECIALFEIRP